MACDSSDSAALAIHAAKRPLVKRCTGLELLRVPFWGGIRESGLAYPPVREENEGPDFGRTADRRILRSGGRQFD